MTLPAASASSRSFILSASRCTTVTNPSFSSESSAPEAAELAAGRSGLSVSQLVSQDGRKDLCWFLTLGSCDDALADSGQDAPEAADARVDCEGPEPYTGRRSRPICKFSTGICKNRQKR